METLTETSAPAKYADFHYDEEAYVRTVAKEYYEDLAPEMTFEQFYREWEVPDHVWISAEDDIRAFLSTNIGFQFLYKFSQAKYPNNKVGEDRYTFVNLRDTSSFHRFMEDLIYWTTGWFGEYIIIDFFGENVVATVPSFLSKVDETDFFEHIQKMCVMDIWSSDYNFEKLYGPDGYTATIVKDYSTDDFFNLYLNEYAYYTAFDIDLENLDQETQDLSYYLASYCMELDTERMKLIEDRYIVD